MLAAVIDADIQDADGGQKTAAIHAFKPKGTVRFPSPRQSLAPSLTVCDIHVYRT
jgi:hypothetical protein